MRLSGLEASKSASCTCRDAGLQTNLFGQLPIHARWRGGGFALRVMLNNAAGRAAPAGMSTRPDPVQPVYCFSFSKLVRADPTRATARDPRTLRCILVLPVAIQGGMVWAISLQATPTTPQAAIGPPPDLEFQPITAGQTFAGLCRTAFMIHLARDL